MVVEDEKEAPGVSPSANGLESALTKAGVPLLDAAGECTAGGDGYEEVRGL